MYKYIETKKFFIFFFIISLFFQNFGLSFEVDFFPFSIILFSLFILKNFKVFLNHHDRDLLIIYITIFFACSLSLIHIYFNNDYLLIGQEINSFKGVVSISISLTLVFIFCKNIDGISNFFIKYFYLYTIIFITYAIIEILYKFAGFKLNLIFEFLSFFTFDEKGPMSNHLTLFFREHSYSSILLNLCNAYLLLKFLDHNNRLIFRILSFIGYLLTLISLLLAFSKLGLITTILIHALIILFTLIFFFKKGLFFFIFLSSIAVPVTIYMSNFTKFKLSELISLTLKIFSNSLYSSYLKVKSLEIFLIDPLLIFTPQGPNNYKYLLKKYLDMNLLDFNEYPVTENYMIDGVRSSDGQVFYLGILGEFGIFFFLLMIIFFIFLIFKLIFIFIKMYKLKDNTNFFHYLFLSSCLGIILLSFFSMHSYNLFFLYIFFGVIYYEIRKI